MAYAIRAVFDPAKTALRAQNRPDHIAYIEANLDRIVAAGPLDHDDGAPYGGLTVVEVPDRAAAEAFAMSDPYYRCGIVTALAIYPWRVAYLDGKATGR